MNNSVMGSLKQNIFLLVQNNNMLIFLSFLTTLFLWTIFYHVLAQAKYASLQYQNIRH